MTYHSEFIAAARLFTGHGNAIAPSNLILTTPATLNCVCSHLQVPTIYDSVNNSFGSLMEHVVDLRVREPYKFPFASCAATLLSSRRGDFLPFLSG